MVEGKTQLKRGLTLLAATMLVAGSMIGSGVFRKPATMAGQLLSPELLIIVWIVAGLITLIGALVNSEISGMIDATGGQYVYFKEMYGDFTAYIYGWSIFAVIQTGSQAAIAYVFAEYIGNLTQLWSAPDFLRDISFTLPGIGLIQPFMEFGVKMTAILAIIFLTAVNYIGVVFGGIVQTIITIIKISSIALLTILLFVFGTGSVSNFSNGFYLPPEVSTNIISLIGLALAGAFWAYDGWNNVTFVSGEVIDPKRNVPRALAYGVSIVIAVYVLVNLAYLYIFPVEAMKNSPLVAASAAETIFGPLGGTLITVAVIISTFGALNGSILSTARVQYAMARNNAFFQSLGKIHPKFQTPHVSLAVQGIWSALLVLSGSFDTITDFVIFAAWLFYMLGAAGIFVLRKKMPDTERTYKMRFYPYAPIIFVVFSFLFLMNTLISDTSNALMGIVLIALGFPVYFLRKLQKKTDK